MCVQWKGFMRAGMGSINERWMYWEYECVYDGRGL